MLAFDPETGPDAVRSAALDSVGGSGSPIGSPRRHAHADGYRFTLGSSNVQQAFMRRSQAQIGSLTRLEGTQDLGARRKRSLTFPVPITSGLKGGPGLRRPR